MTSESESVISPEIGVENESESLSQNINSTKPTSVGNKSNGPKQKTEQQGEPEKPKAAVKSKVVREFSREELIDDPMEKLRPKPKLEPAKKDPEEAQYTFKPRITPRASSRGRERPPSPFSERLYASTGAGKPKVSEVGDDACTFQPQISKKASVVDRSDGDVGSRLYQRNKEIAARMQKAKEEMDSKLAQECTFAPKLTTTPGRSNSVGRSRPGSSNSSVSGSSTTEKSHRYEDTKNSRLDDFRKMRIDLPSSQSSTAVSTPARSKLSIETAATKPSVSSSSNVFERLGGGTSSSRTSLTSTPANKSNAASSPDLNFTFQPQINKTGRAATPTRANSNEKLHIRLYKEAEQKKKDLEALAQQVEEERKKIHTFSPVIPRSSASIAGGSGANVDSSGTSVSTSSPVKVFDRLFSSADKHAVQTMLDQRKEERELQGCTFHPAIPGTSENATTKNAMPIHIRLSQDAERIREEARKREEMRLQAEMKDVTFKPALPTPTRTLNRAQSEMSVYDRLNLEAEQLREEARKREEQKLLEINRECNFKPTLPASSFVVKNERSEIPVFERMNIDVEKQKKELSRREELKVQCELKDATFSPSIIYTPSSRRRAHNFADGTENTPSVNFGSTPEHVGDYHHHDEDYSGGDGDVSVTSGRAKHSHNSTHANTKTKSNSVQKQAIGNPDKTVCLGDFLEPSPRPSKKTGKAFFGSDDGLEDVGDDEQIRDSLSLDSSEAIAAVDAMNHQKPSSIGAAPSSSPSSPRNGSTLYKPTAASAAGVVSKKPPQPILLPMTTSLTSTAVRSPKASNTKGSPAKDDNSGSPTATALRTKALGGKSLQRTFSASSGLISSNQESPTKTGSPKDALKKSIQIENSVTTGAGKCLVTPTPVVISLKTGHTDREEDGGFPGEDAMEEAHHDENYLEKLQVISGKLKQTLQPLESLSQQQQEVGQDGNEDVHDETAELPEPPSHSQVHLSELSVESGFSSSADLSSPGVATRVIPLTQLLSASATPPIPPSG